MNPRWFNSHAGGLACWGRPLLQLLLLLLLLGLLLSLTRASCCCRATTKASSVERSVQGDTNCGWTDRLATVGEASRGSKPVWSCTAAATCRTNGAARSMAGIDVLVVNMHEACMLFETMQGQLLQGGAHCCQGQAAHLLQLVQQQACIDVAVAPGRVYGSLQLLQQAGLLLHSRQHERSRCRDHQAPHRTKLSSDIIDTALTIVMRHSCAAIMHVFDRRCSYRYPRCAKHHVVDDTYNVICVRKVTSCQRIRAHPVGSCMGQHNNSWCRTHTHLTRED
jgi:hypothetical protein